MKLPYEGPKKFAALVKANYHRLNDDITLITADRQISVEEYNKVFRYLPKNRNKLPFYIRYINNNISIYELPSKAHQRTVGVIVDAMVRQQSIINGQQTYYLNSTSDDIPFPNPPSLQLDAGFINVYNRKYRQHDEMVSCAVEVGYTESYSSLMESVNRYFTLEDIRLVIIIKLVKTQHSRHPIGEIHQMFAFLFRHEDIDGDGNHFPQSIISFGCRLDDSSRNAIQQHFRQVASGGFVGVGFPDTPPCDGPNIPTYQLRVPGASLWHNVADEHIPDIIQDAVIDLWEIKSRIQEAGYSVTMD